MEQSSDRAAEDICTLKRKLSQIVSSRFSLSLFFLFFEKTIRRVFVLVRNSMDGVDDFETSLTESSCSQDEENEDTDNDNAPESALLSKVERKPNVQFGINNKNLDLIYSGHQPWDYGLALRRWVFGANGLAYEMILPNKTQGKVRKCASVEKKLTFFRKLVNSTLHVGLKTSCFEIEELK